jgi:hypothetical protein
MKGWEINNMVGFLDSSPSPHPSPVKGEGIFLIFLKNERRFFLSELFNYIEGGGSDEMQSSPKEAFSFPGW